MAVRVGQTDYVTQLKARLAADMEARRAQWDGNPPPPDPVPMVCPICNGAKSYLSCTAGGRCREPGFMGTCEHTVEVCHCFAPQLVQLQVAKNLPVSGMENHRDATFTELEPLPPQVKQWERCLEYSQNPQGFLWLHGEGGSGKTTLAMCIANEWLERGKPVIFRTVANLLTEIKFTFDKDSPVSYSDKWDAVLNAPLLVMDEFGVVSQSEFVNTTLHQLIDHRLQERLPTVVTTNMSMGDLRDQHPKLASRVNDGRFTAIVKFVGKDKQPSLMPG